jgi:hypothetical protein
MQTIPHGIHTRQKATRQSPYNKPIYSTNVTIQIHSKPGKLEVKRGPPQMWQTLQKDASKSDFITSNKMYLPSKCPWHFKIHQLLAPDIVPGNQLDSIPDARGDNIHFHRAVDGNRGSVR